MRYWRIGLSWLFLLLFTAIASGITVGLFVARYELAKEWEGKDEIWLAPIITAVVGTCLIIVKDLVFSPICMWLTKIENLKTTSEYEFSYVMKFYFFRFFNVYGPLFYIAFAKKYVTGCISPDDNKIVSEDNLCMWELRYELIVMFVIFFSGNFAEIVVPFLKMGKIYGMKFNERSIKGKSQEEILRKKIYIEYNKSSYENAEIDGVVGDYFEIILQSGLVFFFSLAFGFIPLICVLSNIVEVMIDRKKIVSFTRRPVQKSARGHGIFTYLLEINAFIAIFTNFGIM